MYLKPSKRKRAKTRLMLAGLIAAAALGVFALLYFFGLLPGAALFGSNIRPLDYSLPENVIANANGLLYNQGNTLFLADGDGSVIWEQQLEMQDSQTVASDTLICNYAGKSLQVMKYDKSQLFSTTTESEIIDAAAGIKTIAVLTQAVGEGQQTRSFVSLLSAGGEQTGQQIDFGTRQVINFGFYGESDMFWALALDASGVTPVSVISTYKADGSMTNNIQETNQIIENVFLTDTAIYAGGTNALTSYSYFGERQAEDPIYGWKLLAYDSTPQAVSLAYAPRSSAVQTDVVRMYAADLSYSQIRMPSGVFAAAVTQNNLYAVSEDKVYLYNKDGALVKTTDTGYNIIRAKQISGDKAVLWDASRSYIMDLA